MSPSHVPSLLDPSSVSSAEDRAAYADGLRALADWVETTEFPVHRYGMTTEMTIYGEWYDDEGFVRRVGSAIRLIGGRIKKGADRWEGGAYWLKREFGGGVTFRYVIKRETVCTPREVEVVVDEDAPVDEARAATLKAELEGLEVATKRVVKVKTVFDCPPSLLELEQSAETTTTNDEEGPF